MKNHRNLVCKNVVKKRLVNMGSIICQAFLPNNSLPEGKKKGITFFG
jgi:hypothetical protein